jgi:hypothetical protein
MVDDVMTVVVSGARESRSNRACRRLEGEQLSKQRLRHVPGKMVAMLFDGWIFVLEYRSC